MAEVPFGGQLLLGTWLESGLGSGLVTAHISNFMASSILEKVRIDSNFESTIFMVGKQAHSRASPAMGPG